VPSLFRTRSRAVALAVAWTAIAACAAGAWYAGGVLGVLVVIIIGALIVTYRRANPFRNWQTGRPWLRERSFNDRFEDHDER